MAVILPLQDCFWQPSEANYSKGARGGVGPERRLSNSGPEPIPKTPPGVKRFGGQRPQASAGVVEAEGLEQANALEEIALFRRLCVGIRLNSIGTIYFI